MTTSKYIESITAPYIFIKIEDEDDRKWLPSKLYQIEGKSIAIRKMRGFKMKSKQELMNEFGAAWQFFDGFGENWHAVKDCLRSLREEISADAYLIIVTSAQDILANELDQQQLHWFIQVLHEVGEYFSEPVQDGDIFDRPAIPFHVILNTADEGGLRKLKNRLSGDADKILELMSPKPGELN